MAAIFVTLKTICRTIIYQSFLKGFPVVMGLQLPSVKVLLRRISGPLTDYLAPTKIPQQLVEFGWNSGLEIQYSKK